MASKRTWTPAQLQGIETVGQSLLVSAAAGSGKTAMLTERRAHLVCDAKEPCDADELLVVTFTEAAAAEMKSRITQALRTRATADDSPGAARAARQLKLVDAAHVSTLHSFCARVLRQHFHLVGLDPAFTVLDGEEAKLLRTEVARKVFEDRYELDADGEFQRFVDAYGDGDDQRLARLVVRAHDMLGSLVDPAGWIAAARRRLEQAARSPLTDSELGVELHKMVARELEALANRCTRAIDLINRLGGFDTYLGVLTEARQIVKHWDKVFRTSGLSALSEESNNVPFERLPPVRSNVPNKDLAKSAVDSVRNAMKGGTWRELLRFTPDEWTEGLQSTLPHARVFLDLVEQFQSAYRSEKDMARALDFADLERFTLQVLCDPKKIFVARAVAGGAVVSSEVRHVLVDEYQDINEVQDAILSLVSRECVALDEKGARANLFCVGDVKQSIYRFRLAEAARFLDRQRQFRADGGRELGSVIDLQKNFRSRAPLLEAINGVFTRIMNAHAVDIDYDDSHRLHPGAEFPPTAKGVCTFVGAPIELHLLPTKVGAARDDSSGDSSDEMDKDDADLDRAEREGVLVAKRIREMLGLDGDGRQPMCVADAAAPGGTRPIRFGDIVVLLRSMKFKADQYAEVLRQSGIAVHSESGSGFFESTEINDVLSLLSLLDNAKQDIPLAAVLRSPIARLSNAEDSLARIRLAYPRGGEGLAFHECAAAYAREHDDELAKQLNRFFAEFNRWRQLAQRRPLADLIADIYDRTGHLAYCAGLNGGEQRVANLQYLLGRARQFGTFHRQGLARFMQFIENLREESDLGQPAVASEADDVVRIMSVHRSKGLEFPVVFLPDVGKTINLDDCQGNVLLDRRCGLGMKVVDERKKVRYPSLASTIVRNQLRQQVLAEEMRVLYVAMTRAKEHLVLVGTCGADAEEQWRSRWSGHAGCLPAETILSATTMLDWLGPVAAASGAAEPVIEIQSHSTEEVAAWRIQAKQRQTISTEQERRARLEPLDPAPTKSGEADDLIRRLSATYPHQALAAAPAAMTMSGQVDFAATQTTKREGAKLEKPRFMLESGPLTPTDIGSATHMVLEHLDFTRPCDKADVLAQIAGMVRKKLISQAQANSVKEASIAWLAESPAGSLLRRHSAELRRELPLNLTCDVSESKDPQDRLMLRGRMDVLIPLADGNVVIDYKTDRVPPESVDAHAQNYLPQLRAYSDAITAITGKPVKQALLVYLSARRVIQVTG